MKIKNKTNILTRNLKTFLVKACEKELLGPDYTSRLYAIFRYRRRTYRREDDCPGGYGWYEYPQIEITLVKDVLPDKRKLAKVISHELAHTQGVKHRAMQNTTYGWHQGWEQNYLWADALELTTYMPTTAPAAVDQDVLKLKNARTQAKSWERKLKLAKTFSQKWKEKVKHYEAKVAKTRTINVPTTVGQQELAGAASCNPPENTPGLLETK